MKVNSLILGGAVLAAAVLIPGQVMGQSLNDAMLSNAVSFLNVPYQAGTLEVNAPREELVINCDELDCQTLVEYTAALSLTPKDGNGDVDEEEFAANVQALRYRDGKIDGYTSRLHYMTEWVENGIRRGNLEDVTAENSHSMTTVNLGYMTAHPGLYPQLQTDGNLAKMKAIEAGLSGRQVAYVTKEELPDAGFGWIRDGDIILITSGTEGLDVAHCGIAFNISGKLTLLHASSQNQKVVVSKYTLRHMLSTQDSWTGIRVVRVVKK